MIYYVSYSPSGEIMQVGQCSDNQFKEEEGGLSNLIVTDPVIQNNSYVKLPQSEIFTRPTMPCTHALTASADGVTPVILYSVPLGATVTLGELSLVADGDDIELFFDIVGTYKLKVSLFPYLDHEAEIDAT